MKKNNTLKVVLFAILITYLLTWLLPITYYYGGVQTDARIPVGLFDIFNYPIMSIGIFGQSVIYIIIVGIFYSVFEKTGVYRKVADKIAKLFKGKEIIFFLTVVTLLSVIVAFCGFGYELVFLLPLLAAIILLMGYDKLTVAITLIGSVAVGYMGSLYASSVVGNYIDQLSTSYSDLIWFRLIMLLVGIAILCFNILWRIKKKDIKKDDDKELIPEKVRTVFKKGKEKSSWPAIVVFDLVLVLMVFSSINFVNAFGVTIFQTFHEKVLSFDILEPISNLLNFLSTHGLKFLSGLSKSAAGADYLIFAKLLGSAITSTSYLGNWTVAEFSIVIILATIVLALIYHIKPSDLLENCKDGFKKFALPAILVLLAYTVLITTNYSPIVLTIVNPLMQITNGFNSIWLSITMFVTSVFYVDPYYIAGMSLPYVMGIIEDTSTYPLIEFICQAMQGLSALIAPTSLVLLAVISYLKINYTTWLKTIWKFFLELFVVAFILFIIVLLI